MAQPIPAYDNEPPIVELDAERHADLDLSHRGRPEHRRYHAFEQPDGTILLKPELTDEEIEERILANADVMSAIETARKYPERSRPRPKRNR